MTYPATGPTSGVRPGEEPAARTVRWSIPAAAAALGGLWLVDLFVLRTHFLATWKGATPLVPLYAFWQPVVRPESLLFVGAALGLVAGAGWLTDPSRMRRGIFAVVLLAAALALPLALFLVRQDPGDLGREFLIYENDEFYFDALRIRHLRGFLKHYVALMPQLSTHGQHFPPGNATLLYVVARVFGSGTLPAGITCLLAFALAIVAAWGALECVADARAARQGGLLLLASPSLLDFACTSMDAVFLLLATIAWSLALRAFEPQGCHRDAIATGCALLVATFFSFSALPVGLCVGLLALAAGRARPRRVLVGFALAGAGYVAAALLLQLGTGVSLVACLSAARKANLALMTRAAGGPPGAMWPELSFGNAVAFAIGAGVALVPVAADGAVRQARAPRPWAVAALLTLVVMSVGGIYFLETERIWLFALPWLAAIAVSSGPLTPGSLRLALGAGLLQTLAMEVFLFTLW